MEEAEYLDVNLRQLKLRSGISMQARRAKDDAPVGETHFLAAIEGKGILLSHNVGSTLTIGDDYRVTGFNGQYDFYFDAIAIQYFGAPFAHTLVSYPRNIKAKKVRQASRMKVSLPATLRMQQNGLAHPSTILDLSPYGAMLMTSEPLGGIGTQFHLEIDFELEGKHTRLTLVASVRHSREVEKLTYHTGVSFQNVTETAKLMLHYLTYSPTVQAES